MSLAHLLAISLVWTSGCGSGLPQTAPVRGVVTYDGKPLGGFKNAAVIFTPAAGRRAKSVVSLQDGSFELSTFETGDGASIGNHMVAVSATVEDRTVQTERNNPGVRSVIPAKFANGDTSGLTYEVKPGSNDIEIQIRSTGMGTIVTK